jgi:aldose 1-epimerase
MSQAELSQGLHPGLLQMSYEIAEDGEPPQLIELCNRAGMRLILMDIGATWLSCQVPLAGDEIREVLLGVDNLADFRRQSSFLGTTIGRYANRIANANFSLDGKIYHVHANERGNCLHGGEGGFHTRRWSVNVKSAQSVCFSLVSPDKDQGFPGCLNVSVTYTLRDDHQVVIDYTAVTDKPTPVNLTNHAYFNLLGADSGESCLQHQLWVDASSFLPVDETGIPLGDPTCVDGTGFDFRQRKSLKADFLKDDQQKRLKGYDHAYVLNRQRQPNACVAELTSPDQRLKLSVNTTMPAMQLYSGNWLEGTPGRAGQVYHDYAGVALETEFLPDSPNHKQWQQPDCILRPGHRYMHQTTFGFKLS